MEDAVCLANQVEAMPGDYEGAFKKYQELRYLRTARVQLMARVFGEFYHASGGSIASCATSAMRMEVRQAASTWSGSMAISGSCRGSETYDAAADAAGRLITTIEFIPGGTHRWRTR